MKEINYSIQLHNFRKIHYFIKIKNLKNLIVLSKHKILKMKEFNFLIQTIKFRNEEI